MLSHSTHYGSSHFHWNLQHQFSHLYFFHIQVSFVCKCVRIYSPWQEKKNSHLCSYRALIPSFARSHWTACSYSYLSSSTSHFLSNLVFLKMWFASDSSEMLIKHEDAYVSLHSCQMRVVLTRLPGYSQILKLRTSTIIF